LKECTRRIFFNPLKSIPLLLLSLFIGDAVFAGGETIKADHVVDGSGKMSG